MFSSSLNVMFKVCVCICQLDLPLYIYFSMVGSLKKGKIRQTSSVQLNFFLSQGFGLEAFSVGPDLVPGPTEKFF